MVNEVKRGCEMRGSEKREDWISYLSHLECTHCGRIYPAEELHGTCPACSKVLYARYDLNGIREALPRQAMESRIPGLWKWREMLPVRSADHALTLGEGGTPLLAAPRLGRTIGAHRLLVKDEGLNPTGSFKARGLAVAASRARELGVSELAIPSAGNAGSAMAAYAARGGLKAHVFVPADTPATLVEEARAYGAHVVKVDGLIHDAGRIVRELAPTQGWFDVSTLKEPYRAEGKKTLGLELAEALRWELPDAILYPTGGGTGIVGMWKAFAELETLGWIDGRRPRMIVVQAEGCAPIVRAFRNGEEHATLWEGAHTVAPGIRVPAAIGDYLVLRAVRESGGTAITVTDAEILDAMQEMARLEGLLAAPEGAATWAACRRLFASGFLHPEDRIVLFNTGSGLKTPELLGRGDWQEIDANQRT